MMSYLLLYSKTRTPWNTDYSYKMLVNLQHTCTSTEQIILSIKMTTLTSITIHIYKCINYQNKYSYINPISINTLTIWVPRSVCHFYYYYFCNCFCMNVRNS